MTKKKKKKRVVKAVGRSMRQWRDEPEVPRTGGNGDVALATTSSDPALEHLADLESSPFGRIWLQGDLLGEQVQMPAPPLDGRRVGQVAPMPRRRRIDTDRAATKVPTMSRRLELKASALSAYLRMWIWLIAAARYGLGVAWDAMRGKKTVRAQAKRLRKIIEGLGPTFIKLGQQLSLRADMIPYEFCEELAEMLDKVEPMDSDDAIASIERVTGKPIGETFLLFDPTPIGSASLACVYQALLHDGSKVAVKVRRPGIVPMLAADLRAMGWLMKLGEVLTIARPGMTKNLRVELYTMLAEELDFHREGRYATMFRDEARRKKQDYITAPRVYFEHSSEEVLVTELVEGVFISELLHAIDRGDEKTLDELKERNIDPEIVAKRLLLTYNWEMMENSFFHADPHPANIIVKPGNQIVFIDFGSCGRTRPSAARSIREFYYYLEQVDIPGMTRQALTLLEPLPPIDLDSFTKDIESLYWDWYVAAMSPDAEWWEKASGVMWMRFIEMAQRYAIPVNLDTLRSMRVAFLFDTILFRICKTMDANSEYKVFAKKAGKRARKRIRRDAKQRLRHGVTDEDFLQVEDMRKMHLELLSRLRHWLDTPPKEFGAVVDKAAYGVAVGLQAIVALVVVHAAGVIGVNIYRGVTGSEISTWEIFTGVLSHPLYQLVPIGILLLVVRKLLMRFRDIDVH